MKNFKTFINEAGIAAGGYDRSMALKTMNMAVYSDPSVVRKLNAWVGTIAGSYTLPEDAIHNMRTNLSSGMTNGLGDTYILCFFVGLSAKGICSIDIPLSVAR